MPRFAGAGTLNHIDRVRGESIETVVVVFPGALGDLLLALPALRALRARHDGARFTLVLNERLRDLGRLAGIADATVAFESPDVAALLGSGRVPAWLETRPHVYSWLGAED